MVADAIEHDHLAVEVVEGPQAKVAVCEQLGDRHISVVNAVEQGCHGRRLVNLGGFLLAVMRAVVLGQHRLREIPERAKRVTAHCAPPALARPGLAYDASAGSPRACFTAKAYPAPARLTLSRSPSRRLPGRTRPCRGPGSNRKGSSWRPGTAGGSP